MEYLLITWILLSPFYLAFFILNIVGVYKSNKELREMKPAVIPKPEVKKPVDKTKKVKENEQVSNKSCK